MMIVGLVTPSDTWDSLNHVRQTTAVALEEHHSLRPIPQEYPFASRTRREALLREWLFGLDAIVGPLNYDILQARLKSQRHIPWAIFVLGSMPRGAFGFSEAARFLSTADVLVCNCTADVAMSQRTFPNATSRLVPFAYDDSVFYRTESGTREAMRTQLGLSSTDRVVLYSGRFTVEKNVHSVLKVFRVVLDAVPCAKLLLAGDEMRAPFSEFGSLSLSTKRLLRRATAQLGMNDGRVMFVGSRSATQLRDLYNAADVLMNLTLHHDENFGLAQVEAMACGLPVVGTAWGGLKDTVDHGVTGAHVPTIVTMTGVKVDWWVAANSLAGLIGNGGPTSDLRERCCEHARQRYSRARYAERLHELLLEIGASSSRRHEPLIRSQFAETYWQVCGKNPEEPPPYRRGEAGMHLYCDFIRPYASTSTLEPSSSSDTMWLLPVPISFDTNGNIEVNDPIFPFELKPPKHLAVTVRSVAEAFATVPLLPKSALALDCRKTLDEGLAWMCEQGLLVRTSTGSLTPDWERLSVGKMIFRLQRVDFETDLVWFS